MTGTKSGERKLRLKCVCVCMCVGACECVGVRASECACACVCVHVEMTLLSECRHFLPSSSRLNGHDNCQSKLTQFLTYLSFK